MMGRKDCRRKVFPQIPSIEGKFAGKNRKRDITAMQNQTDKKPPLLDEPPAEDPLETARYFRSLTAQNPDDPEHHFNLGAALIKMGDYKSALVSFKQAVALDSDHAKARYDIAFCYQRLGYKENAIIAYEDTLSVNPKDDQAWGNLGVILFERDEWPQAVECYQKSVECNPRNRESWKNLGCVQFLVRQYEESVHSMKQALDLDEFDAFSWQQLGLSHYAVDQTEEGIRAFSKTLEIDDRCGETWNNLGNGYLKSGDIQEAENAYRKAIELNPQCEDFWFNLGELVYQQGLKEAAIPYFSRVTELKSDDLEAWEYLARAQYDPHPIDAERSLEKVLELGGDKEEFLNLLAELLEKVRKSDKETQIRLRLAKTNPFLTENNYRIAKLKLAQGQLEIACRFLNDSLPISGKDYQIWFKLAQSFQLKNKIEEEFDCLEKVIRANSQHYQSLSRLGQIALEKKLPTKAFHYFMKAVPVLKNHSRLWVSAIKQLADSDEYELALQGCGQLIPLAACSVTVWSELFRYFKHIGKLDVLVPWLLESLKSPITQTTAVASLGGVLERFGYQASVKTLYRFLWQEKPDDFELLYLLGEFYRRNDQFDEAVAVLLQGLNSQPDNYLLLNLLGETHLQAGKPDEADVCFQQALIQRRDDYRVWLNLGNIEYLRRNFQEALEHFDASISKYSMDSHVWFCRGRTVEKLESRQAAQKDYLRAVELDRSNFRAWNALGAVRIQEQKPKAAKHCFLRSLAENRAFIESWINLAAVFDGLGESEKAQSCLQWVKVLDKQ